MQSKNSSSHIDTTYSSGAYFAEGHTHVEDAEFKVRDFAKLFVPFTRQHGLKIRSYVDVGCGAGEVVKRLSASLQANGIRLESAKGYDVSPHVLTLRDDFVEYVYGDFCASDESADLVTLFDVFEHVRDPVQFLKLVSQRCKILVCHIPLDHCVSNLWRNKYRGMLSYPGHLTFMDTTSALNLLALSGLRVVDYHYCKEFLSASGHESILSKIALPVKFAVAAVSPWLLSKTLGGMSLTVVALTEDGLRDFKPQGLL